jgi:hypothetical protein
VQSRPEAHFAFVPGAVRSASNWPLSEAASVLGPARALKELKLACLFFHAPSAVRAYTLLCRHIA